MHGRRHLRKPFGRRPDVLNRRAAASRLGPDAAVEEPDKLESRSSSAQHCEHVSRRIAGGHFKERRIAFVGLIPAYVVLRFEYKEPEIPIYVQIRLLGAVGITEVDAAISDRFARQSAHGVSRVLTHAALEIVERFAAESYREIISALPVCGYIGDRYFPDYAHSVAVFSSGRIFFLFRRGFVCCRSFIALIIVWIAYIVTTEIIIIGIIGIVIVAAGVISIRMSVRMLRLGRRLVLSELSGLIRSEKRKQELSLPVFKIAVDNVRHRRDDRIGVYAV